MSIDEAMLERIEKRYAEGVTSVQILDVFASHGVPFSEATLRKYVQLGLLPRSKRVGRKGKHQGSQGIYPVGVVRQILRIKEMMARDLTIEQIQTQFLFIRSDLQQLEQTLGTIFGKLEGVVKERRKVAGTDVVARQVDQARELGSDLVSKLEAIEERLVSRSQLERVVAS